MERPDAIMYDLEDGVMPDKKNEARIALLEYLMRRKDVVDKETTSSSMTKNNNINRELNLLRINRYDTPWFNEDASLAYDMCTIGLIDGIVLPKINIGKDVDDVSCHLLLQSRLNNFVSDTNTTMSTANTTTTAAVTTTTSPIPLWAMIETPRAILSLNEITSRIDIHGLILGTNDLGKDLQLRPTIGPIARSGLLTSIQYTILAARAYNKIIIDGVYNDIHDEIGFKTECQQAKAWGMDGKTLIHPKQISWTNDILGPSDEEIDYAHSVVRCWEDAAVKTSSFSGVAVLDGKIMIEQLHVDIARRILRQAEMIKNQ